MPCNGPSYYPPIIYFPPGTVLAREENDPRFFAQRASRLLSVGRVDEANADLNTALSLNPNFSDALALQSIIAVVQNDKEKALNQAQKAVVADPQSAAAQIALSYARQARFDLEGARTSVEAAVKLDPGNADCLGATGRSAGVFRGAWKSPRGRQKGRVPGSRPWR